MSKRDRDGNMRAHEPKQKPAAPESQFTPMFMNFRNELDQHHDRRERVIKASRDVTALSKKMVNKLGDLPNFATKEIATRMEEIKNHLTAIESDIQGINRYRYAYSLRCLEELVEALSFSHYLRTQTLISPEETAAAVPANVSITENDYMYGLFDLFGEMMRFATVTTAQTGQLAGIEGRNILQDIHELSSCFEILPEIPTKDFRGKMEVMRQSVRKVEKLGYGLAIRGTERPKGWVPDMKEDFDPSSLD
ncbi:translin [Colletotrichum higginsianum]|uniref:Translin n=1 Tax=Colletotrichum higginsianum (strain IMI 349063) TaxID=759273 RepID=H1V1W0_COLHI|nr:Translin [Colletotrichum higginsianum IMI 349063]OBR10534.1 Translin [Colletotrichum higginsianum IMI 349063]CCF34212.1 translin [Colletotrichum higginsianum]